MNLSAHPALRIQRALGAAYVALAILQAVAILELGARLAGASPLAWERVSLVGPTAIVAAALGGDYLICGAVCAWQWGRRLRRGESLPGLELAPAAVAHALVVGVGVSLAGRGAGSRVFLAGLDRLVSTMVVAAILALFLLACAAWSGRKQAEVVAMRTGTAWALLAAGVGAAVAFVWVEAT